MKTLDFNTFKKSTFPVILRDKEKTKLTLLGQTLEIAKAVEVLGEEKNNEEEAFAYWCQLTALILSRNQEGITVKASEVNEIFDLEEMLILYERYMEFNVEIQTGKN